MRGDKIQADRGSVRGRYESNLPRVCVCVLVRARAGDKNEVRGEEQRSREG